MPNLCPKCGSHNPSGVDVCTQCAAPLARICANCGFANPINFKFCGNCGANLLGSAAARPAGEEERQRPSAIPTALAEKITRVGKQIEGERRNVTVLFCDISGFTTIAEKLDPEQVYDFIDSVRQVFTDEIYKHEGTLDKWLGDGLMALFGAPVAHEDDPARAVRTALGMQDALRRVNADLETRLGISLKVRIGLNAGTVVVGSVGSDLRMDYTALGDTVNVASRLQNVAEPGTILVSRAVYEPTKPLFEFRELGSIRVKNRVEPVDIFEVVGLRKEPGRTRGIAGLTAPMVGREEEFARLRLVVDALAEKRQGKVVLVTGEAGIGKSRLTAELKGHLADKPATVLEGACSSYGQSAYGVFLHLLRAFLEVVDGDGEEVVRDKIERAVRCVLSDEQAVSQVLPYIENLFSLRIIEKELAERVRHLEPARLQQQTFLAVRDLLQARAQHTPLVLIFEDIHWIDKTSLDLLLFLLGTVESAPLLLYCNSRPTEGVAASQVQRLSAELYQPYFLHIPLAPLSRANSVALNDLLLTIAELPESLKQMIPQRAEGNPFYLEEIIRMLIDRGIICRSDGHWQMAPDADLADLQVPSTLQALILTRVDHLNEGARQTLHYASVIGKDFSRRLLNAVMDSAPGFAEQLQELEERELIHLVAQSPDYEYRFHHGLIQETVYNSLLIRRREYLHHKIAQGIERLFTERIEDHVEQLAFHYAESKDADRALPYLIRAGDRVADRFANDQALGYYRLAVDCLTQTKPTFEQRIQVNFGLGRVQTFLGDYEGAINSYLNALDLTRAAGAPQPRAVAEIMRRLGRVHERRGDNAEALRWLQSALTELDRDPDSARAVERVHIYNDTGWVYYRLGQFNEAYQWRMRSLQIVEGTEYYNEMATAYNGLAVLFRHKADWARALAYTEKALHLRETIGDLYGVSQCHTNLGVIAKEQCDWNQALHNYQRSLEIKQKIGDIEGTSRLTNNLGSLYRDKGDYARAAELFQRALDIAARIKNGNLTCLALNNLAHVMLLRDQPEAAMPLLSRSHNIAAEMGSKANLAEAQWLLAEAHLAQNQLEDANRLAQQAMTIAAEVGLQLIEGQALRALGKIARAQRDLDAADGYLQRSLSVFTLLNNPFELAKSQFELARLVREHGDLTQARALLESAQDTFARLSAEAEKERVRKEMQ